MQEKIYFEIIKQEHSISQIVSHLSLGEAFVNCLRKSEEQAKAFIDFINKLYPYLRLVGNHDIEKQFESVRHKCPNLSITDTIHLSTALRYKCETLRTNDKYLYGVSIKN